MHMTSENGFSGFHRQAIQPTTFDTRFVPFHERINYWEGSTAEKVVGLDVSSMHHDGLVARCSHFDLGCINIIDITGEEHLVQRTPNLLRRREKDSVFLTSLLEGSAFVNRANRCTMLEPGDVVIYDTNHPYMHGFPGRMRHVIFEIPGDEFRARFSNWDLFEALRFDANINPSRAVATSLRDVLKSGMANGWNAGSTQRSFEDQIWDVLEIAHDLTHGDGLSGYHILLRKRVMAHIEANLRDPDLTPARIARDLGLNIRQINRLFEKAHLPLMAQIQSLRLEKSAEDLCRSSGTMVSVSDIAYKWGFKSLSHFSRRFQTHYGCSPSRYRGAKPH
jgi:AraC-like DNA-binding protein